MPTLLQAPDVSRSPLTRLDNVCKAFIAEAMQGGLRPRRRAKKERKRFPLPPLPRAPSLHPETMEADEMLGPSVSDEDAGIGMQAIQYDGLWPRTEPGCSKFPPLSLPSTWMLLSLEADKMMRSTSSFHSVSSRSMRRSQMHQTSKAEKFDSTQTSETRAKEQSDAKRPVALRMNSESFIDEEGPNRDLSSGSGTTPVTHAQASQQSAENFTPRGQVADRQSRPSLVRAEEGSIGQAQIEGGLQELVSPDSDSASRWARQTSPSDITPRSQDRSIRMSRLDAVNRGDSLSTMNPALQSPQTSPTTASLAAAAAEDESKLDQAAQEVFVKVKWEGENQVHRSSLLSALELLGFVAPKQSWVDEIFEEISPQYNQIEFDVFRDFIRKYIAYQDKAYEAAFARCDGDGSGLVEAWEVAVLLRDFDIEPMTHVLQEVIDEVDKDRGGTLDPDEFKELMELLKRREGFTASEYEEFVGIFDRHGHDGTNLLDSKEFQTILNWLGFCWPVERTQKILDQVDHDKAKGKLNQRQYLQCMRRVRESELELLQKLIKENDADHSGTINMMEVVPVLKDLGYEMWDISAIHEAAEECGVAAVEMDLSAMWRLLLTYRQREGFCNIDLEQIDASFHKQDKDDAGHLPALEATRALRELGFTAGFHVMHSVLNKVDVDDTGTLDKREFRKMVRMLQERDIQRYKKAFHAATGESKALDERRGVEAVRELGFRVKKQYVALAARVTAKTYHMADPFLDEASFVRVCCRHARDLRLVYKSNGGWTEGEVTQLEKVFNKYDVKRKGFLSSKELVRMVEDMFPVLARDRRLRPDLQRIMKEALSGCTRSEGVGMQDFLKLMQFFREFQDGQRLHKEQQAVQASGWEHTEVAQLRDLFIAASNASHESSLPAELSFEQFRTMIHDLYPLGDALTAELKYIFAKFTRRILGEVRSKQSFEDADFPEFLLMMRYLWDTDWPSSPGTSRIGIKAKFQDKAETDKPAKAPPAKATSTVGGAGPSNVPKVQGPS